MSEELLNGVNDCIRAIEQLKQPKALQFMDVVSTLLAEAFTQGNKLLIAGNGGSLCDATHFAEELTGFFRHKRKALPAIALADPGHITCTANDMGFEWVFSRGIEAYGKRGDVFVALTTSGNSPNMLHAVERSKQQGLHTVSFLGKNGGRLLGQADHELLIKGFATSDRVQEAHMAAIHLIIEQIEAKMLLAV